MLRGALVAAAIVSLSACAGSSTSPSPVTSGTITNIAGTWTGTIASSNNQTMQFRMVLTQSSSAITGTWDSSSVSWSGQITGSVDTGSFAGQMTFSGTAADSTVCTGNAAVTGPAGQSSMSWTSNAGVVGGACPAPLPIALKIDVQKQ